MKKYYEALTLRLILLILLFIGSLFLFGYIIDEVLYEKEEMLDASVSRFISNRIVSPHLTSFMRSISFFASSSFLMAAYTALFIWYLFFEKNKVVPLGIAIIGLGGYCINYFLKNHFRRIRPSNQLIEELTNFSFPSGHATSGCIFYGLVIYLVWKEQISKTCKYIVATILALFACLIGFSRIYLNVHFTSDVIAGFCVGFAWLALALTVLEHFNKRSKSTASENYKMRQL